MSKVEFSTHLINIYRNSGTIKSLAILLSYILQSNFILVTWYINEKIWYIPIIYDRLIDLSPNTNKDIGWYLREIPTDKNIPIRHAMFTNLKKINFYMKPLIGNIEKNIFILYDSSKEYVFNNLELFILESYLHKIVNEDDIKRQKIKHEITINNISHNIKSPINNILSIIKLINNDTELRNIHENTNMLNQSSIELANNIFDVIDLTKLELGKLVPNMESFNLKELFSDVINICSTIKNDNIKFNYDIDNHIPSILYSDKKRLKQIIFNITKNLLEHREKNNVNMYITCNKIDLLNEDSDVIHIDSSSKYNVTIIIESDVLDLDEQIPSLIFKPLEVYKFIDKTHINLRITYLLTKLLNGVITIPYCSKEKGICYRLDFLFQDNKQKLDDVIKLDKHALIISNNYTQPFSKYPLCNVLNHFNIEYNICCNYEEIEILYSKKIFDIVFINMEDKMEMHDIDLRKKWPCAIIILYNTLIKLDNTLINTIDSDLIIENFNDIPSISEKLFNILKQKETNIQTSIKKNSLLNTPRSLISEANILVNNTENKRINILLVEDDYIGRIVLEKLLQQNDYAVDSVSNGTSALDILKQNSKKYDIVITDIQMSDINGVDLVKEIRKNKKSIYCVIGITAGIIDDVDIKLFDDFVHKPINIKDICEKIKHLVSR